MATSVNADSPDGLLRAILESAVDYAIVSTDTDGVVTSWSEGASRLLGWTAAEAIGRGIALIFTDEDRASGEPRKEMSAALAEGRADDERWHVRKDGTTFWGRSEMVPLRDDGGRPIGLLKILRDRSRARKEKLDRAEADRAQMEGQAYLRLAVDAGRMAVWDFDVSAGTLEGSPELYRLFGFPEDASPTLDEVRARYFPGEHERLARIRKEILERGERFIEIGFRCIWPDGSIHWLTLRAEIFKNEDGSPRRYLGVLLDVSRQRSGEIEAARGEVLKQAILGASLDCIISIDAASRIVEWNAAAEETFGIPRHLALGRDLAALIIPQDLRAAHNEGMRRYLATGAGPILGRRVEIDAQRSDGSRFPVELAISAVSIAGDRYFTAFLRDITRRREEEARRQLLTRELAHRVKNTLALVQTIVSQTLRRCDDVATGRASIEARLVALAQAHDSLTSAEWASAPIHDIVEGALRPYREDGRFEVDGPELHVGAPQALALSLALNELATNATKYGALSDRSGRVSIAWTFDRTSTDRGFRFGWTEHGGPPVVPPAKRGFGSTMIERSLAGYFGGDATLAFETAGLRFTLEAPIGEVHPAGHE